MLTITHIQTTNHLYTETRHIEFEAPVDKTSKVDINIYVSDLQTDPSKFIRGFTLQLNGHVISYTDLKRGMYKINSQIILVPVGNKWTLMNSKTECEVKGDLITKVINDRKMTTDSKHYLDLQLFSRSSDQSYNLQTYISLDVILDSAENPIRFI